MDDFGCVKNLFLIRHGKIEERGKIYVLSDEGRRELIKTTENIRRLSENYSDCELSSSSERRAVETAFAIGDYLGERNGIRITATRKLGSSMPRVVYEGLMEVIANTFVQGLIFVGHVEGINHAPAMIRDNHFGLKDTPRDFGKEFGHGVYLNLANGNYERI